MSIAHAGFITEAPSFAEIGANILSAVLGIFGVMAIISLVVVGIAFFFSFGNEQTAGTAKKALLYSVIGIVVALGAVVIMKALGGLFG